MSGKAPYLPDDPEALGLLLDAYTLDKILYELLYELNNRPDWVCIPLQGIESLIEREHGRIEAEAAPEPGALPVKAPAPSEAPHAGPRSDPGRPTRHDHRHAAQRFRPPPARRGDALPVVREARAPTSSS